MGYRHRAVLLVGSPVRWVIDIAVSLHLIRLIEVGLNVSSKAGGSRARGKGEKWSQVELEVSTSTDFVCCTSSTFSRVLHVVLGDLDPRRRMIDPGWETVFRTFLELWT
jgi:hypothetical protein